VQHVQFLFFPLIFWAVSYFFYFVEVKPPIFPFFGQACVTKLKIDLSLTGCFRCTCRLIIKQSVSWFIVVCALINNDNVITVIKMLWTQEVQPSESTTNQCQKKCFFSECKLKKALRDNSKLPNQIVRLIAVVVKWYMSSLYVHFVIRLGNSVSTAIEFQLIICHGIRYIFSTKAGIICSPLHLHVHIWTAMWLYRDIPFYGNQMDNITICNKHKTTHCSTNCFLGSNISNSK